MIKAHEEESSNEFELVSDHEVEDEEPQVEDEQQKREEAEKEQKADETLIALKALLIEAEENEDILYGQNQAIAVILHINTALA
jgi:hypothetical protein